MHNSVRRISRHFVENFLETIASVARWSRNTDTQLSYGFGRRSVGFASDTQSRDLGNIIINSYCVCPCCDGNVELYFIF